MSDKRALLLTDVVDSTRLVEQMGDAASSALWAAHDRAARDLLPRWRGREIEKTDGLLLLFERADDAVGYALDYHAALARLPVPLQARAGLHVGPVTLRENSAPDVALGAKLIEVEGLAKPIAARVMALALGGQTLLTADARQALVGTRWRTHSHGHWRFKGIAEPVELFEAGGADSAHEPAPFTPPMDAAKAYRVVLRNGLWLPARQIKHSLPAERDDFVDRHDAQLELARRFDAGARLVSVLGMGGTGKTRLAVHFSWAWLGDFPGGVWFCDLSQAHGLDGIVLAVAAALGVPLGRDDPVVQLGNAIAGRGVCLVILDNFEQVSRHVDDTLGRWLDRADEARFLVTSREVLDLAGEEVLALPPLQPSDAAALFVRRAESARADFQPSVDDQAAILPLVKLLDGLPLAIELAAARVRVLSPSKLLARMSERFKLLASSGKRHDRQATLRATFDWSWELLRPSERAALAQLSVFEGGFTLEAAEAVLDLAAFDAVPWPTDVLQSLVDKSFVRKHGNGRFDLLVSMQEYAAEHLRTPGHIARSGPQAQASAQARHAAYFAALGEQRAVADGCVEIDNLVVACRRAAVAGNAQAAVGALEGAWAALRRRGPFTVGHELACMALATPGLSAGGRARADCVAGIALEGAGQMNAALRHFGSALELARGNEDRQCEVLVLCHLGDLHRHLGRTDEGKTLLAAALVRVRVLQDPSLECEVLSALGSLHNEMGRIDEARANYEAALAVARAASDRRWEGGLRGNLGNLHANQGKMNEARADYEAALQAAREVGDRQWEGNMLCNLGYLHQTQGRPREGRLQFEAALVIARELGYARLECVVLCNLGLVCESLSDANARASYQAALVVARRMEDKRSEGQVLGYLGLLHAHEGRFDLALDCLETGEQRLRDVSDRISLGVLLCQRAEALLLTGADTGSAFGQAQELAIECGAGPESELGQALARVRGMLPA
ncbi:MAG: tetratricopeptide repeat protein [Burkholderiaceae bacterium]